MLVALCTLKTTPVIHIFDEQFIGENLSILFYKNVSFRIFQNHFEFNLFYRTDRFVTFGQRNTFSTFVSFSNNKRTFGFVNRFKWSQNFDFNRRKRKKSKNRFQIFFLGHHESIVSRIDFASVDSFEWTNEWRRFEFISKVKRKKLFFIESFVFLSELFRLSPNVRRQTIEF